MEESELLSDSIHKCIERAIFSNYEFFTPELLLLEIVKTKECLSVLEDCDCNIELLKEETENYIAKTNPVLPKNEFNPEESPLPTVSFEKVFNAAEQNATFAERNVVDIFDIIIAMFNESQIFCSYILKKSGIEALSLIEAIADYRRNLNLNDSESDEENNGEEFSENSEESDLISKMSDDTQNPSKFLAKFTVNLTEKAKNGDFDVLIGREEELDRTIHILCRRAKNNPIHVGDAGVGKTALAEGLAQKIANGDVPERLQNYEIFSLEVSALLAGTKFRGEFEARLKKIIESLSKKGRAILYIDEIHTIVGAGATGGGNLDAANILKPILAKGNVRVMGATTYEEYSRFIEKNRALSRRFQKVDVPEPSRDDAIKILKGIAPKYEEYHNVSYPLKSLQSAVDLSVQYLPDRKLPDKAIDIIDEAGVFVSLQNERKKNPQKCPNVTENIIKKVTAKIAKVPLENVNEDEKSKLRELESNLKAQIFGQDEAVKTLSLAVKKARAGFRNLEKPECSFLFVGPTGVGKTELTKVLGELLGEKLIRFDMSEYQEAYTVSRLIGSAPGYVGYENGGLLTESVRKNPHSIILFDEIEKAHSDIFNILLQVLDYGTLTDNQGQKADFRNCIIILTSNAGARDMEKGLVGFDSGLNSKKGDESALKEAVSKAFSPEFRNRLDGIITFHHLEPEITENIVRKAVAKISERLLSNKVTLEISDKAVTFLSNEGYSKEFGARNISRTCENLIATPLVDEVLFGKLCNGGKVFVDLKGEELDFCFE